MSIEKTIRSNYWWIIGVKLLLLVLCCWLIYAKISDPERFGDDFLNTIKQLVNSSAVFTLMIVIFLMPVNWLLEAMKWRLLARPHGQISIGEAFQGVISGLTLGFAIPHSIGDYAGRLLSLKGKSRSRLIGAVWLGQVVQMFITVIFGLIGVYLFVKASSSLDFSFSYWWWVGLLLFIILVIILYLSKVKIFGERIQYYFSTLEEYKKQDFFLLFSFSLGRYIVFSIQYLLIINVFEIPLPTIVLFGGISWMFLMKSIVPSFNFLSDLGIRELSVLTYFDLYQVSQTAVLTSSLLLWLVNILIPVLIGLYFVLRLKITSKQ